MCLDYYAQECILYLTAMQCFAFNHLCLGLETRTKNKNVLSLFWRFVFECFRFPVITALSDPKSSAFVGPVFYRVVITAGTGAGRPRTRQDFGHTGRLSSERGLGCFLILPMFYCNL